ncbi:MAG: DUF554 domain-containing protein [Erysipelotrichia bacterium]|jgi:uncharacterized membrane protein YqgA involved in biofilm formation|nr:DUF554 domain-containing protein [Erysipelotrichia bacterium]
MIGPVVNAVAIIVASLIGLSLRKILKASLLDSTMSVLGIIVVVIGIDGVVVDITLIYVILSLVCGLWIGESFKFEDKVKNTLDKILKFDDQDGSFIHGFLTASVLFVVGAMAIIGSIESGINQNHIIVFTKSTLDFVAAMMLSATLGFGVLFSFIPVLLYQGALTLFASGISSWLNETTLTIISSVGNILVIALGLNMLKLTKYKMLNLLPSIIIAIIIAQLLNMI